jgi:hypothetical protein
VEPEALLRLVEVQGAAQQDVEDRAVAQVIALFGDFDGWYDHDAITRVADRAGQTVRASAQASASLSDAYMTRVLSEALGGAPRPAGAIRVVGPLRDGVPTWGSIYGRVADTVRFQVAEGKPADDAVRIGLSRADSLVRTDLSLARRDQYRRSLSANPRVTGYRRVIHPEMSRTGTCGLCIAAADRRYNRAELMPLHARCVCTVAPITAAGDPGGTLNDADLAAVYSSADSNRVEDLKKVRYTVEQHGELGPVLVNRDDHWRGPTEVLNAA